MIIMQRQLLCGAMIALGYDPQYDLNGDMVCVSDAPLSRVRVAFVDDDHVTVFVQDKAGLPVITNRIVGEIGFIASELRRLLNPAADRVKILEAGIEAALTHLSQDSFRSQAIAHAKSRLEKALNDGRY